MSLESWKQESIEYARQLLRKARQDNLKPPPNMKLVEWADAYRYLSQGASSEAGKWKTSNVEVCRGPMEAYSDPHVKIITVMCCTQLMKTELINNIVGYHIDLDPAPMIVMQPNEKLGEAWSKDRLATMIRDTPALKGKIKGDKILHKTFAGGHVSIVGSNAPGDLAMRPVRVVLCDETDKYPASAGDEGDPISLIAERQATFWNSKLLHVCSPTVEGRSRIALEYSHSDQRIFEVPCPYCGHREEMTWDHVVIPKDEGGKKLPKKAHYACPKCTAEWTEPQRQKAIKQGTWRATKPFTGHAGFNVSKLASPWETIGQLAEKWLKAQGNPQLLKTFINTQLAQTWKQKGDAPEWKRLYDRRDTYTIGTVPEGVLFLTAAADVQKDRVEVEIVGWGRGKRSWSIDYIVIPGRIETQEVQDKLSKIVTGTWTHKCGVQMSLLRFAIDTGYNAQVIYNWTRNHIGIVMPVKGMPPGPYPILCRPTWVDLNYEGKHIQKGIQIWGVGTDAAKTEIYGLLQLSFTKDNEQSSEPPPGYCRFPEYNEDYFKMLTAEQLVEKKTKRGMQYVWDKFRERNEALDCRVYNRAAAAAVGIDRFEEEHWRELEAGLGKKPDKPEKAASKKPARKRTRKGTWIRR
ncbi:phage terminase large subunit family protein [Sansalvadorimonas verongulae]|uniref:phage terminase large subunit family protein n=1 Tax=Sansalvadorimonas verongulae TaxID=2172824 RepID=UPI0012BD5495|nr:phage terminase large subunit family protein [Sansalvadorimonas verongulae]MTI13352.1 phage terminase large subunit family protein [Sansalvadorimonas verongulae]